MQNAESRKQTAETRLAHASRPAAPEKHPPRSAYIHIPFCRHRCGYCNFTLVAGRDDLIEPFLHALEQELSWLGEPHKVETLFLGGGTPTHLQGDQLRRLLNIILRWHPLTEGCEFSVEANPNDVNAETIDILADHGVTPPGQAATTRARPFCK
jgi:oxygen-independent coproporphyrinogen-3 oxidase